MQLDQVLFGIQKTINAAKAISGPLAAIGVPGAGLVKAALEIAENVKKRIDEGAVVASSADRARVQEIIEELQAENDRLAAEIDQS